jgi:hypothetical protein
MRPRTRRPALLYRRRGPVIDIAPNFIARPYRGVSVQEVPSLEPEALRRYLLGRRVYRRTEFLVAVREGARAVVQIEREPTDGILAPVRAVRVLAGPEDVVYVEDEAVDTGNATQLARAAGASGRAARVYVVQGRFQHVNLIVAPAPLAVRVVEVVPPEPPKLLEMARAMVDVDEDLPPLDLQFDAIDLRELIASHPAPRHLLPCRSGGLDPELPLDFLDSGPPTPPPRDDWTLVGCERSRQIYAALYDSEPPARVDFCPRVMTAGEDGGRAATSGDGGIPTLLKCCLRERGIERDGNVVVVPWGATLDEVRAALRLLAGLDPAPPAVAVEP